MRKGTRILLKQTRTAFLACAVAVAVMSIAVDAGAEPKGPNGEKCSSSETGVKHDIKGVSYTCDKCVYSKCDTSGGQISNCQQVTYWSNCVAASVSAPPYGPARTGNVFQNAPITPAPPQTSTPKAPAAGGINRQ